MTTQGMPSMDPRPSGLTIGTYDTYREAQRAVDYLSDEKFPVEHTTIVGNNLRQVEKITGRLTWGRALTAGLASGAWFGLFVGLLLGIFVPEGSSWLAAVLTGVLLGSLFGMTIGAYVAEAFGWRLAFLELQTIVAAALARFTIEPTSTDIERPRWRSVIVTPHRGCRVVLRER